MKGRGYGSGSKVQGICLFLYNFGIECHFDGDVEWFTIGEGNGVGVGDGVV